MLRKPCIYSDRQAWKEIPENLRRAYIEEAEKFLDYTWPNINAVEYLEFVRSGNREIMQVPYRQKEYALEGLAKNPIIP